MKTFFLAEFLPQDTLRLIMANRHGVTDDLEQEKTINLLSRSIETEFVEYGGMIHGFITMGGLVDAATESMQACAAALARAFGSDEVGD